jgi:hypothetical protein
MLLYTGFVDKDEARWLRGRVSLGRRLRRQQSKG